MTGTTLLKSDGRRAAPHRAVPRGGEASRVLPRGCPGLGKAVSASRGQQRPVKGEQTSGQGLAGLQKGAP